MGFFLRRTCGPTNQNVWKKGCAFCLHLQGANSLKVLFAFSELSDLQVKRLSARVSLVLVATVLPLFLCSCQIPSPWYLTLSLLLLEEADNGGRRSLQGSWKKRRSGNMADRGKATSANSALHVACRHQAICVWVCQLSLKWRHSQLSNKNSWPC